MEKKHVVAATCILALLVGGSWDFLTGDDAEVVEAKQMRDELINSRSAMSPEQRQAGFEALREKTRSFSAEQRQQLGRGRRQRMQSAQRLLAMSPEEQRSELDKMIDERAERSQSRGGQSGRGGEGRGGRDGQRGGGGGKGRLDNSTPQMRANRDAMRDLMNERLEERGMDPIGGGAR